FIFRFIIWEGYSLARCFHSRHTRHRNTRYCSPQTHYIFHTQPSGSISPGTPPLHKFCRNTRDCSRQFRDIVRIQELRYWCSPNLGEHPILPSPSPCRHGTCIPCCFLLFQGTVRTCR